MEVVEKREIFWPLPRIEPRFRGRPVHTLVTETGASVTYGELVKRTLAHVLNFGSYHETVRLTLV
jgi:hypothetical protein